LYSLRSVSFGSGEGLVVGDMCSGELAVEAATAAAAAVIKFNAYLSYCVKDLLESLEITLRALE
jgi:hypothetical protein